MATVPYAGGKGMERDVGNLGSVPEVMESLDSRSGGVSFSISWMLRSDCLPHNTPLLYTLIVKISVRPSTLIKYKQRQPGVIV